MREDLTFVRLNIVLAMLCEDKRLVKLVKALLQFYFPEV
jgi:hypothetical protein